MSALSISDTLLGVENFLVSNPVDGNDLATLTHVAVVGIKSHIDKHHLTVGIQQIIDICIIFWNPSHT